MFISVFFIFRKYVGIFNKMISKVNVWEKCVKLKDDSSFYFWISQISLSVVIPS